MFMLWWDFRVWGSHVHLGNGLCYKAVVLQKVTLRPSAGLRKRMAFEPYRCLGLSMQSYAIAIVFFSDPPALAAAATGVSELSLCLPGFCCLTHAWGWGWRSPWPSDLGRPRDAEHRHDTVGCPLHSSAGGTRVIWCADCGAAGTV